MVLYDLIDFKPEKFQLKKMSVGYKHSLTTNAIVAQMQNAQSSELQRSSNGSISDDNTNVNNYAKIIRQEMTVI